MSSFQFQADMYNSITPEEIQAFDKAYGNGYQDGHREGYDKGYEDAKAKYERPHGKWEFDSWGNYCSECGYKQVTTGKFCSECGADMREVDDE